MKSRFQLLAMLVLLSAWSCAPQNADLTTEVENPAIQGQKDLLKDPAPVDVPPAEADKLISDLVQLLKSSQGLRVHGTIWQVGLNDDGRYLPGAQSPPRGRKFRVDKPNKLLHLPGVDIGPTIASDGKQLTFYAPTFEKALIREPAPASAMELLKHPELSRLGHPMMFFPLHLASDEAIDQLFGDDYKKELIGGEEIDGQPTYHVRLTNPAENGADFVWHVWLAASGKPLPLQVRFDLGKQTVELPGRGPTEMLVAVVDRFIDWQVDPGEGPGEFEFIPPVDARPVISLYEQNSPLVGNRAPQFSLERLGGGTASLTEHQGKDIVVLDFWATWCEPCVDAMPAIDKLAKDYAGRGVAFYSVNLGDSKEIASKFLETVKIDMPVLLDTSRRVGSEYGAETIPMLVVIDQKGIVRAVDQGFDPSLELALRKQLDSYLGTTPTDDTHKTSSPAPPAGEPTEDRTP